MPHTFHPYSTDEYHVAHAGLTCEVVSEIGSDERDAEVGPMFTVKFDDGTTVQAFAGELSPRPESNLLTLDAEGEWIENDPS